jgi:hypothetical protein
VVEDELRLLANLVAMGELGAVPGVAADALVRAMMGADICVRTESLNRTYERPALRKSFAALPADSKVAAASFAVIATVVSMSDRLPPAAAASIAEAAAFSSGNSAMASQSGWPKVKYHPMSLPPTLLKSWQRLPHDFPA